MNPEYLVEAYKNAVYQKDVEAFLSIFDENVRVFDLWRNGTIKAFQPGVKCGTMVYNARRKPGCGYIR